jgi:alcohol dehydrogenase
MFIGEEQKSQFYYIDRFIEILAEWTETMNISRLGKYGIKSADVAKIVKATDIKNNPVKLNKEDLAEILESRL